MFPPTFMKENPLSTLLSALRAQTINPEKQTCHAAQSSVVLGGPRQGKKGEHLPPTHPRSPHVAHRPGWAFIICSQNTDRVADTMFPTPDPLLEGFLRLGLSQKALLCSTWRIPTPDHISQSGFWVFPLFLLPVNSLCVGAVLFIFIFCVPDWHARTFF